MNRFFLMLLTLCMLSPLARAQSPAPSKVDMAFNKWYTYDDMTQSLRALVRAYPNLLQMESLGKSVGDRDIWLVTLNDPETGPPESKTAMYIEGNIHGNEIQATEAVLYTI